MKFRGIKLIGAVRCDEISFSASDYFLLRAFDGTANRSGWATLSLPTARKLANAILKAVDTAEGK